MTVGRRTGATHDVPVWFAAADGVVYIPVRNGLRSDWLRNALAAGRVELRIRTSRWSGSPHVVESSDELEVALAALTRKYERYRSIVDAWRAHPPTIAAVVSTEPS